MSLFNNIQKFCGEINESACYALSILAIAEKYNKKNNTKKNIDVLDILHKACTGTSQESIIYYNQNNLEDNNNFYVQHADELFTLATGKKCTVTKVFDLGYEPEKNEFIIKYYERIRTGYTVGHFETDDFKPIKNSLTVQYGTLKSLRVIKVL